MDLEARKEPEPVQRGGVNKINHAIKSDVQRVCGAGPDTVAAFAGQVWTGKALSRPLSHDLGCVKPPFFFLLPRSSPAVLIQQRLTSNGLLLIPSHFI